MDGTFDDEALSGHILSFRGPATSCLEVALVTEAPDLPGTGSVVLHTWRNATGQPHVTRAKILDAGSSIAPIVMSPSVDSGFEIRADIPATRSRALDVVVTMHWTER